MEIVRFTAASGLQKQLCRINDGEDIWVCFHEVHTKLLQPYSKATLRTHFDTLEVYTRHASNAEKLQLFEYGAIKIMVKTVLLVEITGLCKAVRAVTRDKNLTASMARISTLPATSVDLEGASFLTPPPSIMCQPLALLHHLLDCLGGSLDWNNQ